MTASSATRIGNASTPPSDVMGGVTAKMAPMRFSVNTSTPSTQRTVGSWTFHAETAHALQVGRLLLLNASLYIVLNINVYICICKEVFC